MSNAETGNIRFTSAPGFLRTADLARAGLIPCLLAVIIGILGMHVMAGTHSMSAAAATGVTAETEPHPAHASHAAHASRATPGAGTRQPASVQIASTQAAAVVMHLRPAPFTSNDDAGLPASQPAADNGSAQTSGTSPASMQTSTGQQSCAHDSGAFPTMTGMHVVCVPAPGNASLAAPLPSEAAAVGSQQASALAAVPASAYRPDSPSRGQLCISRT